MIKLPSNKDLTAQLLLRDRGVPGYLISIKLLYTDEINCLRITFTDGCSCCGQFKYVCDIQSPNKEDLIKSIKKFSAFSYLDKSKQKRNLWINTNLLKGITCDVNNYQTIPQKIIHNYETIKNFLINIETNQNIILSEVCRVRIKRIGGETFSFNHSSQKFDGNFDIFDTKRIFEINEQLPY